MTNKSIDTHLKRYTRNEQYKILSTQLSNSYHKRIPQLQVAFRRWFLTCQYREEIHLFSLYVEIEKRSPIERLQLYITAEAIKTTFFSNNHQNLIVHLKYTLAEKNVLYRVVINSFDRCFFHASVNRNSVLFVWCTDSQLPVCSKRTTYLTRFANIHFTISCFFFVKQIHHLLKLWP